MSRTSRCGRALAVLLAWATILLTAPLTTARAQQPEGLEANPSLSSPRTEARPGEKHWLSKLADAMIGTKTSEHARSHPSVLNAFSPVVELPAQSTVRIWCDNRQVAMGTIIDSDGLIATKASELGDEVVCELRDGTRHPALVVGVDRGSDLALLSIPAQDLPAIHWSEEDPPSVGGWVVTPGLIDVPLAIGIVSVAPHHVRGGVLGIQMTEDKPGPRITYVVPGSGAAVAGLLKGDIITHANGKLMENSDDMVATTSSMLPDEKIQLSILRLEKKVHITATLGSVADTLTSRRARFQDQLGAPLSKRRVLFPSALEHDSVLAPKQCGGVLTNLSGEAIGINIARASRISCYAIPARVARPILESLRSRAAQRETLPVAARGPKAELTEAAVER